MNNCIKNKIKKNSKEHNLSVLRNDIIMRYRSGSTLCFRNFISSGCKMFANVIMRFDDKKSWFSRNKDCRILKCYLQTAQWEMWVSSIKT